jgi:Flp pilus assembly protein TadD
LIRTYIRFLAAIAALCLSSCSGGKAPGSAQEDIRLLLLPFENDSSDAALNWLTPVSSAVLEYDLNSVAHWTVLRGDSVRNIGDSRANRVLEGYFAVQQNKLTLHAFFEEPLDRKILRVIVREGPANAGIQPLLDSLAKELHPTARPFSSQDPAALQSYGEALQTPDPAARIRLLETATTQDPKLSAAGVVLGELLLSRGDGPHAAEVASRGARNAADPIDKARLEYLAATARDDFGSREKSLQTLAKLAPNANIYDLLGQLHTGARKYREAIQDYEAVARLEPRNPGPYNFLGYLYAYLHDLPNAQKNLDQYGKLAAPNDPNPSDSMGEVHFLLGDFAAAERYFLESHAKSPAASNGRELLKAATALLMTGDVPGADAIFQKYLDLFKNPDPQANDIPRAQWEFFSGRRRQAMARLERLLNSSNPDTFAYAGAQLSFWKLMTGDRYAGAIFSMNARARATNPGLRSLAAVCQWLAQPTTQGPPPNPWVQAVGMVLLRQLTPAAPVLEKVYRETPPTADGDVRALLAWVDLENKQAESARPLVDLYPLVFPAPDALFAGLTFPKFLAARAESLKIQHNDSEAQRMQQLANRFAGDVPDRF